MVSWWRGKLTWGDMHIAFGQPQTHPFHAPEMISLSDFDSYLSDMEKGYVLVDHERRRRN